MGKPLVRSLFAPTQRTAVLKGARPPEFDPTRPPVARDIYRLLVPSGGSVGPRTTTPSLGDAVSPFPRLTAWSEKRRKAKTEVPLVQGVTHLWATLLSGPRGALGG